MIPYTGAKELLVVSLDIGDSSSSVTLAHLEFGKIPDTRPVTRYPGSSKNALASVRLPSLVAYDEQDRATAVGFDVSHPSVQTKVRQEDWIIVSDFKKQLSLSVPESTQQGKKSKQHDFSSGLPAFAIASTRNASPSHLSSSSASSEETAVPDKKRRKHLEIRHGPALKQVYADYLNYLVACAKSWWTDEHSGEMDEAMWHEAIFVFAHPPDWTARETDVVREAFHLARLLPRDFKPGKLHFVRELACVAHFARVHGASESWLQPNASFVIVDISTHTTTLAPYTADSVEPRLKLRPAGAVSKLATGTDSITAAFRTMLTRRLSRKWRAHNDRLVESFCSTLPRYGDSEETVELPLQEANASDPQVGIRDGHLHVQASEIDEMIRTAFVDPLFKRLDAVLSTRSSIILNGDLGECPFIRQAVRSRYCADMSKSKTLAPLPNEQHMLVTTDIPSSTSVSQGASLMYIDETVFVRRVVRSIGTEVGVDLATIHIPTYHQKASAKTQQKGRPLLSVVHGKGADGRPIITESVVNAPTKTTPRKIVGGHWSTVLAQGAAFQVGEVKRKPYHFVFPLEATGTAGARSLRVKLYARKKAEDKADEVPREGKPEWIKLPGGLPFTSVEPARSS